MFGRETPMTPASVGQALNLPWNPIKTMLAPSGAAKTMLAPSPVQVPVKAPVGASMPMRGMGWRNALIGMGIGGGVSALHQLFGKEAFLEGLQHQWQSLDPKSQLMAGTGAALAGAGGLHSLLADDPGVTGPLLMAGGAGLGLYGMSGQNFHNVPQMLSQVMGGGAAASPSHNTPPSMHPSLQKFIGPDGKPKFTDIVKAPDAELLKGVSHMTPEMRQQLVSQLEGFQPGLGQRLAARTMGIDIDAQRKRLLGLLGQPAISAPR
jgi:hypothetical protein